jgi:deoxyribose-phosphate aldolase
MTVREMSPGVTMEVPPIEMLYDDVTIMKKYSTKPIKASAGITTRAEVEELLKIGAQRIGSSNGVRIVNESN